MGKVQLISHDAYILACELISYKYNSLHLQWERVFVWEHFHFYEWCDEGKIRWA